MDKAYSPTWFQYNKLSQITPMPAAWDRTASGPSNCDTTISDCAAVYNYLAAQAKDLDTYATSPLWAVVDGPWKLSAFNADGHVRLVPNKSYSGPVKPKLAAFEEVPFTTDAAEYDVLQSPSSSTKIDYGYMPAQDAAGQAGDAAVGANPLASKGYTLAPLYAWGIGFYVMNFQSTTGNGPIIRQLYFRQAMAYLMDQQGVINGPLRGYATPTVGPVGNHAGEPVPVREGQAGRPVPVQHRQGQGAAGQQRLEGGPGRGHHLHRSGQVRAGDRQGQDAELQLPVRQRLELARVGDDGVAVERGAGGHQAEPGAQAVPSGHSSRPWPTALSEALCAWDMANYGGLTFSPDYLPTGDIFTRPAPRQTRRLQQREKRRDDRARR